jgi:hypothetical protein
MIALIAHVFLYLGVMAAVVAGIDGLLCLMDE